MELFGTLAGPDGRQLADEGAHRLGVRTSRDHSLLGAPHPRRGHQLHRLGDLGGIADATDAPTDIL
jgi:hypothetical protein